MAMKTNRIQYFLKEGLKNIVRNKFMSFASIGTSFATLFILGVFLVLTVNINDWAQQIARDCQMQVFIEEGSTAEQYTAIGEQIKKIKYVENVEKYTKEQIFEEMKEELGVDENGESILTGFEHDNPYRDSYKVTLKNPEKTANVRKQIKTIEGVAKVTDFQETVDKISSVSKHIRNFSIWVFIILGLISAFIISNSIKTSVFARRKEIHIMKYIGATNWFVRWPFLIEGMIIGLIGAILSFFVIWLVYWRIESAITIDFVTLVPFMDMCGYLALVFTVAGVVIGLIGSFLSVRKHLKV